MALQEFSRALKSDGITQFAYLLDNQFSDTYDGINMLEIVL